MQDLAIGVYLVGLIIGVPYVGYKVIGAIWFHDYHSASRKMATHARVKITVPAVPPHSTASLFFSLDRS